ncbi:MAG: 30S ribosomal protein S15 [Thaumarchaeota archaeon 13_1_40CM_38_12]|nr:MAG: 30S ribosomal protein S15 [Thaumarchaeota archaeon 13_1_40CM_38_12]OLC36661.1 MAG: 30S ribosomal protein S15 [Thaumarchaeota archaeon 13_1_40CM_4_38_7]OLC91751.1 MAG: 30S ribosomal protein S15 [Thaumarchaeota archaeon 13_1_40CM_3_38_6]OLD40560.1 MAG: 30S ribosomal protein S15 [Thaumarchaeota archaeon 13_1_40CM_2_39_4]TLY08712.1 MAG: 30S ribosomal protein S15 [Nitrososphaerota archaeon]
MGRVHSHRHGKSHSIRPVTPSAPTWVKQTSDEVEELVVKYAKEGLKPSEIGIKLRDQYAIPLTRQIVKKSVTEILEQKGVKPDMPEDLNNLVTKSLGLQKHLRANKSDRRNVRSLELLEAKVHRLSSYYKEIGRIPKTWKYKAVIAQLE